MNATSKMEPREVVIDGIRYVPAREAVAGLADLRTALEDVYWGEGYAPERGDRSDGLYVSVYDDAEGTPLSEFMDAMASRLTRLKVPQRS